MQNIVEIIRRENKMAIVLRSVTANTYSAQVYVQQANDEFTRIGTLVSSDNRQRVIDSARTWVERGDGQIVLANR